jgi:glycosyltransferase involved in cell wall biosynthesis
MRIVHISSTDLTGGAGRAAYRLHRALLGAGLDSTMLVREKCSTDPEVEEIPQTKGAVDPCAMYAADYYIHRQRTPGWNTYFSLAWPGVDLSTHPLVTAADVIHLHWLWDFQSAASLGRLMRLGKPVVWSFHDQRAFTGGCHYSAGCDKYTSDCSGCPQLKQDPAGLTAAALADQARLWPRDSVTVIGLSHWMAECARKSRVWRGGRVEVIHNCVETDRFLPLEKRESRRRLGLPEDAQCVLFGADYGIEIRKGFHSLMGAMAKCMDEPWFAERVRDGRICCVCFGNPGAETTAGPVPIRALGYLREDAELAAAYSAADVFVLPSIEDNLPNTVLESMSCGTPVLAYDAGGVRDMVVEEHTGWLVPVNDEARLAGALLRILAEPGTAAAMARACREHVANHFSPALQVQRFSRLYHELLRKPPAARREWTLLPRRSLPAGAACGPKSRGALAKVLSYVTTAILMERLGNPGHPVDPATLGDRYRLRFFRNLPSALAGLGDLEHQFPHLLRRYSRDRAGKSSWWKRLRRSLRRSR